MMDINKGHVKEPIFVNALHTEQKHQKIIGRSGIGGLNF